MGFWWEASASRTGFYEILTVDYSSRQRVDSVTRSHSYVFDPQNRPLVENFRTSILAKYGKPSFLTRNNEVGSTAVWFLDEQMQPFRGVVAKICLEMPEREILLQSQVDVNMRGLPRMARAQCPASLWLDDWVDRRTPTLVADYKMYLCNGPVYWKGSQAEKAKAQQQLDAERRLGESKRPDL